MRRFLPLFWGKQWFFILLFLLGLTACQPDVYLAKTDLEKIQERGVLRVGTLNNQLSYYITPEGPSGLEYDLAEKFAQELGVKLEIKPVHHRSALYSALRNDEIDVIAAGLIHPKEYLKEFNRGPAYYTVSQQLIYKVGAWRPKNLQQLIKKKKNLVIVADSQYEETLKNLATEDPELTWTTSTQLDSTALLRELSKGNIDFTVVDSTTLSVNQRLNPNLSAAFDLTEDQPISWLIRKTDDDSFYALMLEFFGNITQSGELANLEEKYFGHIQTFDYVDTRAFIKSIKTVLPTYAPLFREYAKEFDWRLIAAVSYQESHWNPEATSPTGVRGMMMLTQSTAKIVGVTDRVDAEQSIRGGVEYLRRMMKRVPESIPEHERIWFALASYNIGYGHMMDARRVTEVMKGNPNSWADVKNHLPKLSDPQYRQYTRYGFARGDEAQHYVESIRRYYQTILGYETQHPTRKNQNHDMDFTSIGSGSAQ